MGRIRTWTSAGILVASATVAACSSGDDSAATPATTDGSTPATEAPTTEASTTDATRTDATTADTDANTSTVAPTDPPSSDTAVPAAVEGAIDSGAATVFGLHLFAERPADDVVTVVSDRLGDPTSDTGFVDTPDDQACRAPGGRYRVVRWGDLRMTFTEYENSDGDVVQSLEAWAVGDERAEQLAPNDEPPANAEPTGLTTTEGIGVGSTRDELREAFTEDQALNDFDEDRISVVLGSAPTGVVSFVLDGDTVVGIGSGPPDCAAPEDSER
ncbi:hypothetical protein [Ilumatobacter nonamiensis]|uniref:hypothetical protein n=1 Tax=Ilumatobacter nonamiensis TaxID=467093 RepID=UPI00034C020C|nr:hypothetical protein [Ilumatobacter nonamiensis]